MLASAYDWHPEITQLALSHLRKCLSENTKVSANEQDEPCAKMKFTPNATVVGYIRKF
jgi:hypothetical protein